MGIHISVVTKYGVSHPDWDYMRHSGDLDIPDAVAETGEVKLCVDEYEHEYLYRPACPHRFYAEMVKKHGKVNASRWDQLRWILTDERWWLHYSY